LAPNANWRLPAGASLFWRQWDLEETVVFNRGAGSTHLIDAFSAASLRRIAAGPCSFGILVDYLSDLSGADEEQVGGRLGEVLDSLQQLGLAEPVSPCAFAS
jgi:PqqD family protein of HPr-rel-A system